MRVTLGLLLLAAACSSTPDNGDGGQDGGNTDAPNDNNQPTTVAKGPSKGSAIAVSADDSIVVATNRVDGSISVFAMTYPTTGAPTATKTDVDLGAGSEPFQVAISPDGDTAYVVLRDAQKLVKVGSLHSGPSKSGEVAVGSEPTGVALSPTGKHAYVANWVDGTVSDVDTSSMLATSIDLNAPLAASGTLGTVTARPALAHPRAIAVTNNLDTNDDDETIYVTEFYAQQNAAEASDGSNSDVRKNGFVYAIKASDKSVKMITLAPMQDTGFKDENNAATGCYPNQLRSIAIAGKFAYVLSVCASPKGPTGPKVTATACSTVTDCASLNLVSPACAPVDSTSASSVCVDQASTKSTTEPLVSIIDTTSNTEVDGRVNLNQAWQAAYVAANTADDNTRRYPLVADDIAFVPGTSISYVSANGADGVFRMRFDASSSAVLETGSTVNKFIDLAAASLAANAGQDPIGIAPSNTGKGFLVTMNEHTHNVSFIDLNVQGVSTAFAASALPTANSPEDKVRKGKRFFNTGMGRWSFKGQGWGACQSCHPDGLTDDVTWYFARGPRQSTSLDGTFNKKDPNDQRVLNWTAIFDEVADFEGNTRGTSGGVGSLVNKSSTPPANADRINLANVNAQNHAGLNGAAQQVADPANPLGLPSGQQGVTDDWLNITSYIKQIRSPRAPTNLDSAKVTAGAALFSQKNCQGCHGGDKWTISKVFYAPGVTENGNLKSKSWTVAATTAGFPAALFPATTPTNQLMRFDSGSAATLDQIQCILRPVGTFNVAETGVGIAEKRVNMTATAQGNETDGKGYNPPSLLGLSVGAPYMHAGNARTLESMLTDTFKQHHQAFAVNFLDPSDSNAPTQRDQLVAFLLSIDGSTQSVNIPALGATGGDFCAP